MAFQFNPVTGMLDLVGTGGGGGGGFTGVQDSDSIDFTVIGGVDITADVNLSAVPADSGSTIVDLSIEADGIRAQIENSAIKTAATDLQGPNTLLNNTTSTAITYPSSNKFTFIDYSIERSTTLRIGRLLVVTDGITATIADNGFVEQGAVGVSFGVAIAGANVQVQYTTTNTGVAGTFKYTLKQWS